MFLFSWFQKMISKINSSLDIWSDKIVMVIDSHPCVKIKKYFKNENLLNKQIKYREYYCMIHNMLFAIQK